MRTSFQSSDTDSTRHFMQPTTTVSETMMILPKTQWLHHNNKDHRKTSQTRVKKRVTFTPSLVILLLLLFILTFSSFMFSMVIQSTLSLTQLLVVKVSALSQCSSSSFIPMIITISPEKLCPSNIILSLPHSLSRYQRVR